MDEKKKNNGNGSKQAVEWFRLITPVLVTISIFFLSGLSFQLHRIDNKLFTHLTNDEIHVPRGQVVTQAEFDLHCKFAKENKEDFLRALGEFKQDMRAVLAQK